DSAIAVSLKAQILNLSEYITAAYGLTLIFLAQELAGVKNISDRVAVMYLGKICEVAPPELLYSAPQHPYTRLLIDAIPRPDPEFDQSNAVRIEGELPSPLAPPSGCRFRTRCPNVQAKCFTDEPQMKEITPGHYVACHYPADSDVNQ
ncbi:MAG: ABC transporter ATP-binding protein, partial [Acidimicrobiales bacterium]|nr:ABC transporter ATP-binding protein [Acidimicrobiales bacterium]